MVDLLCFVVPCVGVVCLALVDRVSISEYPEIVLNCDAALLTTC